jgi:hypothetical protein
MALSRHEFPRQRPAEAARGAGNYCHLPSVPVQHKNVYTRSRCRRFRPMFGKFACSSPEAGKFRELTRTKLLGKDQSTPIHS